MAQLQVPGSSFISLSSAYTVWVDTSESPRRLLVMQWLVSVEPLQLGEIKELIM